MFAYMCIGLLTYTMSYIIISVKMTLNNLTNKADTLWICYNANLVVQAMNTCYKQTALYGFSVDLTIMASVVLKQNHVNTARLPHPHILTCVLTFVTCVLPALLIFHINFHYITKKNHLFLIQFNYLYLYFIMDLQCKTVYNLSMRMWLCVIQVFGCRCHRLPRHRDLHVEAKEVQSGHVCWHPRTSGRWHEVSLRCQQGHSLAW